MSGMTDSAQVQRINQQCAANSPKKVFTHKPTNKRYHVVLDIPGVAVELMGLDGRSIYATADDFSNAKIWSVQP